MNIKRKFCDNNSDNSDFTYQKFKFINDNNINEKCENLFTQLKRKNDNLIEEQDELSNIKKIRLFGEYTFVNKIIAINPYNIHEFLHKKDYCIVILIISGSNYNQKDINMILSNYPNIEKLIFGVNFNLPIDILSTCKLNRLKKICFGDDFNQSIDCLANILQLDTLYFGKNFSQSINALSNLYSLKHIIFSLNYSKYIDNNIIFPFGCKITVQ